jgi:amidase
MVLVARRWHAWVLATSLAVAASLAVGAVPTVAVDAPAPMVGEIDLDSSTIPELQAAMDAGELTSEALVQAYLDRIELLDPHLNAVIAVSPTALDDARAADEARAAGTSLPLLGIPVLLKDNINATGMPTTAGSLALAESSPEDAFLVTRLRDAGAVILGKANLSEWANFRGFPSSSGWSALGGQTGNPYGLDRNPCGSSSGSAAAVAASLATVAVGTETDGSIICPAAFNSTVGIKPSLGLVSRSGVVPISAQQDTAGPIARNVTDATILLEAMTGLDPADPITTETTYDAIGDWAGQLDAGALYGARIGVWRDGTFGIDPRVDAVMEEAIAKLEELGATIVDPVELPMDAVYENEFPALLSEFKRDIALYLGTLGPDTPKSLQDLVDFNLAHADEEMALYKQETFDSSLAAPDATDQVAIDARTATTSGAQAAVDGAMTENDLDAIITPSGDIPWVTDPAAGDPPSGIFSWSPAAASGYPAVTVPAGYVEGLPVGMTFFGSDLSELHLLSLAYAWEQGTGIRVPPTFPDSVDLPALAPPSEAPGSAAPAASGAPAAGSTVAGSTAAPAPSEVPAASQGSEG